MTDISCEVRYRGKTVVTCSKCTRTGLWMMPLSETQPAQPVPVTPLVMYHVPTPKGTQQATIHLAHSAYTTTSKAELAQYHHQSLFSPPPSTVLKAIQNNQLTSFPGLTEKLLKDLPDSTATHKGHMNKNRQNVRSTRSNAADVKDARLDLQDMNHTQEACATQEVDMFCYAALAVTNTGNIYTDLPGQFPIVSIRNMKYIFVCYAYQPNSILVRPMMSRNNKSMVATYSEIYKYLEARGYKPTLNVTDNEASKAVQDYIRSQNVK